MISSRSSAGRTSSSGPAADHPPQLQLRQAQALRQPAQAERQRLAAAPARSEVRGRSASSTYSANTSSPMSARPWARQWTREGVQFGALEVRAGRVVRVDDDDRARAVAWSRAAGRRCRSTRRRGSRGGTARPHRVERGEVLEQRVARRRHEHLVARVAEQLEEQRVRLARAGGQHDAIARHAHAAAAEIAHHRVARGRQAERLAARTRGRTGAPARRAAGRG